MGRDGDAEGSQGDGGSGAEETGETLGAEHFSQHGKQADHDAADQESRDEFGKRHGRDPQAARCALWIMRIAASTFLQPSNLYLLPSRRW